MDVSHTSPLAQSFSVSQPAVQNPPTQMVPKSQSRDPMQGCPMTDEEVPPLLELAPPMPDEPPPTDDAMVPPLLLLAPAPEDPPPTDVPPVDMPPVLMAVPLDPPDVPLEPPVPPSPSMLLEPPSPVWEGSIPASAPETPGVVGLEQALRPRATTTTQRRTASRRRMGAAPGDGRPNGRPERVG